MPCPGEYLRMHSILCNICSETKTKTKTKTKGLNERTDQIPRTEQSDEEIANLSDAQFKTLVIRMLTEMVEYGYKVEEKYEGHTK